MIRLLKNTITIVLIMIVLAQGTPVDEGGVCCGDSSTVTEVNNIDGDPFNIHGKY